MFIHMFHLFFKKLKQLYKNTYTKVNLQKELFNKYLNNINISTMFMKFTKALTLILFVSMLFISYVNYINTGMHEYNLFTIAILLKIKIYNAFYIYLYTILNIFFEVILNILNLVYIIGTFYYEISAFFENIILISVLWQFSLQNNFILLENLSVFITAYNLDFINYLFYVKKTMIYKFSVIVPDSLQLPLSTTFCYFEGFYFINAVYLGFYTNIILNVYKHFISFMSLNFMVLYVTYSNIILLLLENIYVVLYVFAEIFTDYVYIINNLNINNSYVSLFMLCLNTYANIIYIFYDSLLVIHTYINIKVNNLFMYIDDFSLNIVFFCFFVDNLFFNIINYIYLIICNILSQIVLWSPWISINKDIIFVHISMLYIIFLIVIISNTYYLLLYLFSFIVLIGMFIGILQLELFIGFLWLIESTIILVSILILFFLNIKGYLKFNFKVDYIVLIFFKFILFFLFIFLYSDNFKINIQNMFNSIFLWENYYEALSNKNMNDFSGLFIYLFTLFSFDFMVVCLILLFGSLVCIHLYKKKHVKKFENNKNILLIFKNFFNFSFFRKQDLKKQSYKKGAVFKIHKKKWYKHK